MASTQWNRGTPAAPGVYVVNGYRDQLRRYWAPETGFSAPWYEGDEPEIVERATVTPADRDLVRSIRWRPRLSA